MCKHLKLMTSILLVCCIFSSAVIQVCAKPSDLIYNILNRDSEGTVITNPLLLNAMHKEQPVKIIKDKQTLEEESKTQQTKFTKSKSGNRNSYVLGLDISKWNGRVDWAAVKRANIEFIVIRAGYGTTYVDPYFKVNIENAIKHKLIIGIYWFSYAHTNYQARQEAEKCYKTIKPYKKHITLPVFWDFEYDSVNYARRNGHHISMSLASSMADAFCKTIKAKGMQPGIYTNIDYTQRYFNRKVMSKYHTWIAQWTSSCTYKYDYIMWQCTERFYIGRKKFDLNRFYYNRYTN